MKQYTVIFVLVLGIFLISCEKLFFSDQGELQTREVNYDYFSTVSIYNVFDVELSTDTIFSVEVEAYERYIDNLNVHLDSNTIVITDETRLKWIPAIPRPKLRISFPELDGTIYLDAPVQLTSNDTLQLPKLAVQQYGEAGDMDLLIDVGSFHITTGSDNYGFFRVRGKATYARYLPWGSCIIDGSELHTENCYVFNKSLVIAG